MPARARRTRAARRAACLVALLALAGVCAAIVAVSSRPANRVATTRHRRGPAGVGGAPQAVAVIRPAPAPGTSAAFARATGTPAGARPTTGSSFWKVDLPDGSRLTLEKYDAPGPGLHPTVVALPGSTGWTVADERQAARLARAGFTTVTLCWFRPDPFPYRGIACPDAPPFVGVSWAAIPRLEAAVTAVKHLPGVDPARVALAGFSRGGGEALLYATLGGPEPVIAVSALVKPASFMSLPGEADVVSLAGSVRAPTLLLYGVDDRFVQPLPNSIAMGAAIRQSAQAPAPRLIGYRGGHSIALIDEPPFRTAPEAFRVLADEVAFLRSTLTVARTLAACPTGGYYTLDADGTVVASGGARWYGNPAWPGEDIARGLAVMPDGDGYVVLDARGGLHAYGTAVALPLAGATGFDRDLARAVAITPSGRGLVVLDASGAIHPIGDAPELRSDLSDPGGDVARDIAVTRDGRGYLVLDNEGGVHRLGSAAQLLPGPQAGWTVDARRLVVSATGGGYGVVDAAGGLWITGDLRVPEPPEAGDVEVVGAAVTGDGWVALRRDRRVELWADQPPTDDRTLAGGPLTSRTTPSNASRRNT
ncbi:MAG: hypothetical protein JOZ99_08845 [Actinobacteria bacterium]|nr:hypothetical protein [Actinomycetota bacterium]